MTIRIEEEPFIPISDNPVYKVMLNNNNGSYNWQITEEIEPENGPISYIVSPINSVHVTYGEPKKDFGKPGEYKHVVFMKIDFDNNDQYILAAIYTDYHHGYLIQMAESLASKIIRYRDSEVNITNLNNELDYMIESLITKRKEETNEQ